VPELLTMDPVGCLYCGDVFAVLLVTLGDGRRVAAHPSCVAAALRRDPSDAAAREIAAVLGMPEAGRKDAPVR